MSQENIKYILDAEDKATAKIRNATETVKKQVEVVKNTGTTAKASTELVGSLAGALGGSELSGYAGELAGLTERVSAFSEVAKEGGKSALLFKAGLAAVVAIAGFKLGQAMSSSAAAARDLNDQLARRVIIEQGFAELAVRNNSFLEFKISLLDDEKERQTALIELQKKRVLEEGVAAGKLQKARDELTTFRGSREALGGKKDTKQVKAVEDAQKEFNRLNSIVEDGREELKRLELQIEKTFKKETADRIGNAVGEFFKKSSELRKIAEKEAEESAKKRFDLIKQAEVDLEKSLRDQEKAGIQKKIDDLKKQISVNATASESSQGTDQRFGSGRTEVRDAQRDRQATLQILKQQLAVDKEILRLEKQKDQVGAPQVIEITQIGA